MLTILTCRDLDRMRAFYREAFDWQVEVETPNYIEFHVDGSSFLGLMDASLSQTFVGERRIMMEPGTVRPIELYVRVPDPQASIERLTEAGAELTSALLMRSWGEEAAYLLDPEGNILAIASGLMDGRIE